MNIPGIHMKRYYGVDFMKRFENIPEAQKRATSKIE
jgi:hypothetical protein